MVDSVLGERVAKLEEKIDGTKEAIKDLSEEIKTLRADVHALNTLLANVKGARWVLLALIASIGAMGAVVGKWFTVTIR